MTSYRRAHQAGGCCFFMVVLADTSASLLTDHIESLRGGMRLVRARHRFSIDAMVVLPDHLHCIWTLPEDDADYGMRWALIKTAFSRTLPQGEHRRESRIKRGERGIWQRRFWEHLIRDQRDFDRHVDYIHINPVKHDLVTRAIDWLYSSIHRYVREGRCDPRWAAEPFVLQMKLE